MKKFPLVVSAVFLACSFFLTACHGDETNTPPDGDAIPEGSVILPFSGVKDISKSGKAVYYMRPDFNDTYTVECDTATQLVLRDAKGNGIASGSTSLIADVQKDAPYSLEVTAPAGKLFSVSAKAENHAVRLPYDVLEPVNTSNLSVNGNGSDPLTPAKVNYQKRAGGTYIYSNNPELIPKDAVGEAFIRTKDLTGEVYFTFEHANYTNSPLYLGYQLKNEGTQDAFVTVMNIGYQSGGTWFGQLAWYDFYNTKFNLPEDYLDKSGKITDKYAKFDYAYRNYKPRVYQPVTYRLPAGESFYVIGGTTKDAYQNYNVGSTADKSLPMNMCANGNVKFIVSGGSVTGTFYAYNDIKQVAQNPEPIGYRTGGYAAQYMGTADHSGVIDNQMTWIFSDETESGALPVTYTNRYDKNVPAKTTPYTEYDNKDYTTGSAESWVTHLNPQNDNRAVGTDIVAFICTDENGKAVVIDNDHADGAGNPANTANWMIEYMDHMTLVNQGNKERTVTFNFKDNGTLAMLVRDEAGNVLKASYTTGLAEKECSYTYSVTVPAHSIKQITLDYLLVACSYGCVTHWATLE